MKKLFLSIATGILVGACKTASPNMAVPDAWTQWSADLNAAYTEGPTAILKNTGYVYLPQGRTAYVSQDGPNIRLSADENGVGEILWRVRYEKDEPLWTRMSDKVEAAGPKDGRLLINDRYTLRQNRENISLTEQQIRLILFDAEQNPEFSGLEFFPYDRRGIISAKFSPSQSIEPVILDTERGMTKRFFKLGEAEFKYDGETYSLPMFSGTNIISEIDYLFTGFTDATSGESSYGVGRYLDVTEFGDYPPTTVTLDFNRLYNPYCARTDAYNCPVMPTHIDAELPFGERYKAGNK